MRAPRLPAAVAALLLPAALVPLAAGGHAAAAATYSVTTLHFLVDVGPGNGTTCDIVGDVYVPTAATPATPAPAILATNGFGGSKDDLATDAASFADHGYVVLAYSGLGFGGSSCKITLDDPDWDGKAGSQLVSYLGGKDGIAFADAAHTQPAPVLDVVQRDAKDHLGAKSTNDPRVGMIGGSYGGQVQFAVASVDPRLDTIIPEITWNDLSYSLGANNTDQTSGVSTRTPGAVKLLWAAGFSAEGLTGDLTNQQVPPDALPCPNFADWVCPALVTGGTTGYLQPGDVANLRHASVATYMSKIKIPTLLMQGQNDTLFNLNEAVATYQALKAQGTPVKMIWKEGGHSGPAASGEFDYLTPRIYGWFDHYLKGQATSTGPAFAYFRDWVSYTGSAVPAYASSASFPVGANRTWRLSGAGTLTPGIATTAGSQSFLTPAAGAPTSLDQLDVLGSYTGQVPQVVNDAPGTFAAWTSPALTGALDVVGSPVVKLKVDAPTAAASQAVGPAGMLVLFVKVSDVSPDGTSHLVHGLEAPVRIPDVTKPFTVRLPGIVHEFAAGHRLRLTVAGGSANYRGGLTPAPVTIASGGTQTLTMPVVP
jgi:ABC-2 type transport system ATP-binding protein